MKFKVLSTGQVENCSIHVNPSLSPQKAQPLPCPIAFCLPARKHSEFSTVFLLEGGGLYGHHKVLLPRAGVWEISEPPPGAQPRGQRQLSWYSEQGNSEIFEPLSKGGHQFPVGERGRAREVIVFRLPSGSPNPAPYLTPYLLLPPKKQHSSHICETGQSLGVGGPRSGFQFSRWIRAL